MALPLRLACRPARPPASVKPWNCQHLLTEVNLDLPVHLGSVVGEHAQLCEQWSENELKPLLESHREATAASLKRKAGFMPEQLEAFALPGPRTFEHAPSDGP